MPNKEKTYKSYDDFKKAIFDCFIQFVHDKKAISDCFIQFVHDDKAPSILNIKDLGEQNEKDSEDDF